MDTRDHKAIPAGEFKQKCLALLDEVAETHKPLIVTKRGRPVARVVPVESNEQIETRILEDLRAGGARILVSEAEFLAPTDGLAGWQTE